jgi:hypothetical protein
MNGRPCEIMVPRVIETRLTQPWHTENRGVPRLCQPCLTFS